MQIGKREIRVGEFDRGVLGHVDLIFLGLLALCAGAAASASAPASGISAAARKADSAATATTTTTGPASAGIASAVPCRARVAGGFEILHLQHLLFRIDLSDFRGSDDLCFVRNGLILILFVVLF